MKNALRIAALSFVVSAAMLSNAHAGSCIVQCPNGQSWTGSPRNAEACCSMMLPICGGPGHVTYNGLLCDPDYWTNQ